MSENQVRTMPHRERLLGWFEGYYFKSPRDFDVIRDESKETLLELQMKIKEGLANDKATIKVLRETAAQRFVKSFGQVYQEAIGAIYKADKKHFIIATKLIKDHGYDAVVEKTKILLHYCSKGQAWFVKDGYASFTIETLSNRWNNILPIQRLTPDEMKEQSYKKESEKWGVHDANVNQTIK